MPLKKHKLKNLKAVNIGKLYDGTMEKPMENATVVFNEKIIDVVGPENSRRLKDYDALPVDLSSKYMMPGLIDAHVHLVLPGDGMPGEDLGMLCQGEIQAIALKNALAALEHGITTLRDCGGIPEVVFSMKKILKNRRFLGPDLMVCGSPITSTGGHTHYFKGEVDGVENMRHFVRQSFKRGADFTKLIATGGGTRGVVAKGINYTAAELQAAVEEAHRLRMTATAHVTTIEGVRQVLGTGIDGLEHGYFFNARGDREYDPALAEEIGKRQIPVCPTLQAASGWLGQLRDKKRTKAEDAELDRWSKYHEDLMETFARQLEDGVSFIAGSDAGWRVNPFGDLATGLELMAQGGMSHLDVIHSSTFKTAGVLGMDHILGAVRPGLQADLLILDKDPGDNIANVRKIARVYKRGEENHNRLR